MYYILLLLLSAISFGGPDAFYNTPPSIEKALAISSSFKGRPYQAFPLGEGADDPITPRPLYRLDAFDCLTYVESVLALTYAQSEADFITHYKALKYASAPYDFFHRNHFTSIQWNTHNQEKGYIQPFQPPSLEHLTTTIHTTIELPNWYRHLSTHPTLWQQISGQALSPQVKTQLEQAAMHTSPQRASLRYLPLSTLLTTSGQINPLVAHALPTLSLVEVVRKNWRIESSIGTTLDISHIGFLVHQNHQLILRHASTIQKQVVDQPLAEYLQQQGKQKSFAGLYIQTLNLH